MYDVAVVGAGPAGSTAAYEMARAGMRVVLLERAAFPRYKPCGGGVSPAVRAWTDVDFSSAISLKTSHLRCTFKSEQPVEARLAERLSVWMVRREVFDAQLASAAVQAGATMLDGVRVDAVERVGSRWLVRCEQDTLECSLLIGADGSKGQCAKWLGLEAPVTIAGAIEIETPDVTPEPVVQLDFGGVASGYGWVFPKADGSSVGVGTMKGSGAGSLRAMAERLAGQLGISLDESHCYGHPIKLWSGRRKLHAEGALLAGDAASTVDPFTAEGIRYAVISGCLAARAAKSSLEGDAKALARYSSDVHEHMGKDFAWALRLSRLFYSAPALCYRLGVQRKGALEWLGRLASGEERYRDTARRAMRKLVPGLKSQAGSHGPA